MIFGDVLVSEGLTAEVNRTAGAMVLSRHRYGRTVTMIGPPLQSLAYSAGVCPTSYIDELRPEAIGRLLRLALK